MTVISGTGHRGNKLIGGWDAYPHNMKPLVELLKHVLDYYEVTEVHSGMALGYDTALALATLNSGRKLHCEIPFYDFEIRWREDSKELYNDIISKAHYVNYVHDQVANTKQEAVRWLLERNKVLVHSSPLIIALWDGSEGGTKHCIDYAHKKKKDVLNIWDLYYLKNQVKYNFED